MRVRERIELCFALMEREYGVTRLLDPEGEWQERRHAYRNKARKSVHVCTLAFPAGDLDAR